MELDSALRRPFQVIAIGWEGTAVEDRHADATRARGAIDALLRRGVTIAVVTDDGFGDVDRQLSSGIAGPHKRNLFLSTSGGSEVFGFDSESRAALVAARRATVDEERALGRIAEAVRDAVAAATGLSLSIGHDRLNRRTLDLLPVDERGDPPRARAADLVQRAEARLAAAGWRGGVRAILELAERIAAERGLAGARVTCDGGRVEIGLTDKSDAMRWLVDEARRFGVPLADLLVIGSELGPIGDGVRGRDDELRVVEAAGATFVSVGDEPAGAPRGVIHLGGGPARVEALLDEQRALHDARDEERRRASTLAGDRAMPVAPVTDPRWSLVEDGFTVAREHEVESLFAVGNGTIGVRGALAEGSALSSPATFVAGIFARPGGRDNPTLFALPDGVRVRATVEGRPLSLEAAGAESHRRILDMRQGILWRDWRIRDPAGRRTRVRGLRLASLAARSALVQAVSLDSENFGGRLELEAPRLDPVMPVAGTSEVVAWGAAEEVIERSDGQAVRRLPPHAYGEARWHLDVAIGGQYRFDRVVCVVRAGRDESAPEEAAAVEARAILDEGLDVLVRAHVAAWEARWRDADVEIEGDDDAQRALRFAAYHLISSANPTDSRTSIGARGLTGPGYGGHVFWDTEIYMLPFFTFTDPTTARTLLAYRHRTLPAARAKARRGGWEGALYAWESADTGDEETPHQVLLPTGEVLPVYCGDEEQHISADVAYAAWQYWTATDDEEFLWRAGAEIFMETARFWASRGELDRAGVLHIRGVMGPDEYHHGVDDSAFTNAMARFTLERAAIVARLLLRLDRSRWRRLAARLALTDEEVRRFVRLARAVALTTSPDGVIEEFRGYFDLKPIPSNAQLGAGRSVPLDVALGLEGVRETQAVKQADVVLLTWLLEGRIDEAVRRASFRYYEPRTAHSSSLSPGIHALVAARLGDVALAERYFRQTREIDLANNMGNAAGGVHLAALGSLWQAAIFGFAGVTVERRGISFAPALPPSWRRMRFALKRCGRRLGVTVTRDTIEVGVDEDATVGPVAIRAGRVGERVLARPGWRYIARRAADGTWRRFEEVGRS